MTCLIFHLFAGFCWLSSMSCLILSYLAGADYASSSGTLSFDSDNLVRTIAVNISDDSDLELNEVFVIELDANTTGVVVSPSSATITIIDDDGQFRA